MRLVVGNTWDGSPVDRGEQVVVTCDRAESEILVSVDAPFHDDPAPALQRGRADRLWEYEVVELFLLGDEQRYLEVEMGPHGHYLALQFSGPRQVSRRALLLNYDARIEETRWSATIKLPLSLLPEGLSHGNAYAMHGLGESRRYLAAFPVPGDSPDFHRLGCFGKVELS